ncbi:MAG: hypothetical protein D3904_04195, partial [Candidatus Electrothrix sp. EH2]|nr:hypothetical protein [Candidatus Electrothrix sp. EH2]
LVWGCRVTGIPTAIRLLTPIALASQGDEGCPQGDCPAPLGDGLASQGGNTDNFRDNSMVLWYTEVNIPSVTITGVFIRHRELSWKAEDS